MLVQHQTMLVMLPVARIDALVGPRHQFVLDAVAEKLKRDGRGGSADTKGKARAKRAITAASTPIE
jgi:hypothetical protein